MSDHSHPHDHHHDHHHHDHHDHRPRRGGPVVFDIGGDVGALIVYLDDEFEGTEVPIEWHRDPAKDVHTGVWRRSLGSDSVVVAVYPELIEGRYRVPALGGHGSRDVEVVGGQVAELDLRLIGTLSLPTVGRVESDKVRGMGGRYVCQSGLTGRSVSA